MNFLVWVDVSNNWYIENLAQTDVITEQYRTDVIAKLMKKDVCWFQGYEVVYGPYHGMDPDPDHDIYFYPDPGCELTTSGLGFRELKKSMAFSSFYKPCLVYWGTPCTQNGASCTDDLSAAHNRMVHAVPMTLPQCTTNWCILFRWPS